MKLTILTAKSRLGFCEGSVWEWFKEFVINDTDYEVLDIEANNNVISGDRVLLLGQKSVDKYLGADGNNYNLFRLRGTVLWIKGKPTICTFDLQDAYDFKALDDPEKEDTFGKDRAKTQRKNWLFWIKADTRKILRPVLKGPSLPNVIIQPDIRKYTAHLKNTSCKTVYLDIETDIQSDTLDCIGLYIEGDKSVVVTPIYRYTGQLAYDQRDILLFMAALSSMLLRNRVVIHNAMFDLLYLASHYRLPFGSDIFDTMLAHKRAFPEVEKSLGHAISYWTFQPYHKDEHAANKGKESEARLHMYNAKDVWSMREVYLAQLEEMARNSGYKASVEQANASLYPYLLASLKGLFVDISRLSGAKIEADRRIKQIERIIRALIGDTRFNPNSSQQLVKYFHTKLAYKVVERTDSGNPSLGGEALYELALKYDNPLIQCIIYYRALTKSRQMMDFNNLIYPWQSL